MKLIQIIPIIIIGLALLNSTQVKSFNVHGNSMFPTIQDGEVVLAKQIDIDDIKKGDIVILEGIIHRVVKKEGDTLITQGDNPTKININGKIYTQQEEIKSKTIYKYIRKND